MDKNKNKSLSPLSLEEDIQNQTTKEDPFPGYPFYPPGDDIYNKDKEEEDINPEDITKIKEPNEKPGKAKRKRF